MLGEISSLGKPQQWTATSAWWFGIQQDFSVNDRLKVDGLGGCEATDTKTVLSPFLLCGITSRISKWSKLRFGHGTNLFSCDMRLIFQTKTASVSSKLETYLLNTTSSQRYTYKKENSGKDLQALLGSMFDRVKASESTYSHFPKLKSNPYVFPTKRPPVWIPPYLWEGMAPKKVLLPETEEQMYHHLVRCNRWIYCSVDNYNLETTQIKIAMHFAPNTPRCSPARRYGLGLPWSAFTGRPGRCFLNWTIYRVKAPGFTKFLSQGREISETTQRSRKANYLVRFCLQWLAVSNQYSFHLCGSRRHHL